MTARDDRLRERLEQAGNRLAAADTERAEAMKAVRKAVRAGRGRLTPAELARLTGVSRVTVYRLLEEES